MTSVLELITRLPRAKFVMLALVPFRVDTVPLVEVKLVNVAEPLLSVVIPAEVLVSVVIVADVKVAFAKDRLLTVKLLTDRFVIPAEVAVSVVTVPLVEVRFVAVKDPLVRVVMSALP